jgi:RND family efflux transporter MFP subunit
MQKKIITKMSNKFHFNNKHIIAIIIIIILLITGISIYRNLQTEKTTVTIPVVRTLTIKENNYQDQTTYPGSVIGQNESYLSFQVGGKIAKRNVDIGSHVKKGDILFTINPKDIEQTVAANRAALNAANSQYTLTSKNSERFTKLYNKGAVSRSVMDNYVNANNAALAAVNQARAQLKASLHQLEYTKIIADQNGTITEILNDVGTVVAAGTPVSKIASDGKREIKIYLPENKLDTVTKGQKAIITLWAYPNKEFSAHVTDISSSSDSITRTYPVKLRFDENYPEVKLGMTAKVKLENNTSDNLILIPAQAIFQTDGTPKVWIVKDNKVHLVKIEILGYEGNLVKIGSGLKPGDIIVTAGLAKISENSEVRLESGEYK